MSEKFREALLAERFWDQDVEKVFLERGIPAVDCALQVRGEVEQLCDWINDNKIESYLEIGIWTGRLTALLHRLFSFKLTAVCDVGVARLAGLEINLPSDVVSFQGNSLSPIYSNWRKRLGHVDLVFIDSAHLYDEVKRDFQVNSSFSQNFIAFHGIVAGPQYGGGVAKFWKELAGDKTEIICPHTEIGLEQPTMGIGIWAKCSAA